MRCSDKKLFQTGVLCGFIDKVYRGDCTLEALMKKGNLGIGTFDEVHGELVAYDGKFYRIIEDGIARPVDPNHKTPFAWVVDFEETDSFQLDNIESFEQFSKEFDDHIPSQNYIYAYRFDCQLDKIDCRAERCQPKPYQPIIESFPNVQVNFSYQQMHGVMVGFRFPEYLATLNVPGHHIHFLDPKNMRGGHVFDFKFKSAKISVCMIKQFDISLIESDSFSQLIINSEALSKATHAIEKE